MQAESGRLQSLATDWQANRQGDKQEDVQAGSQVGRQAGRETGSQAVCCALPLPSGQ